MKKFTLLFLSLAFVFAVSLGSCTSKHADSNDAGTEEADSTATETEHDHPAGEHPN